MILIYIKYNTLKYEFIKYWIYIYNYLLFVFNFIKIFLIAALVKAEDDGVF